MAALYGYQGKGAVRHHIKDEGARLAWCGVGLTLLVVSVASLYAPTLPDWCRDCVTANLASQSAQNGQYGQANA